MATPLWLSTVLLALGLFTIATNAKRVVRKRSVDGVALSTILLSLCSASSWLTYGVIHHYPTVIGANVINIIGYLTILTVGWRLGALRLPSAGGIAFGYAAIAGLASLLGGLAGLATVMSVLTFATRIPQLRKAWTEPGGAGISVTGQSSDALQCSLWALNGFIIGDHFMVMTSTYCMAASLFVVMRAVNANRVRTEQPTPVATLGYAEAA